MARLAKFWNSTIFFNRSSYGRSYRFEVLGIAAGREEEEANEGNPSILRAFRLFLKSVENLSTQRVIFTDFYRESDIPDQIWQQKPLVMDPSNPYNNLMYNFKPANQELFSQCAKVSLSRLVRVERQVQYNHGYPDFKLLFLPQPKPVEVGPQIQMPKPDGWLVGTESRSRPLQPNLIVRNSSLGNDKLVLGNIKKILSSFLYVADMEAQDKGANRKRFAQDRIKETVDDLFGDKREWSTSHNSHADYDVTFEIPIGREGRDTLIISSNWRKF